MSAVAVIPQFRNIDHYIAMIKTFPMLTREEEYRYATSFRENGNSESARRLIASHLILVVKIARKLSKRFRGPLEELVSEGNLGKELGISGERVRQICSAVYKKVQADIIAYMSINNRKLLT
jgi:DNA-directed RNA polymerase sigma subunit (sigma70/sigma32)